MPRREGYLSLCYSSKYMNEKMKNEKNVYERMKDVGKKHDRKGKEKDKNTILPTPNSLTAPGCRRRPLFILFYFPPPPRTELALAAGRRLHGGRPGVVVHKVLPRLGVERVGHLAEQGIVEP